MLDQPIALATELGGDAVEENPYLLGIFAPVDDEITADDPGGDRRDPARSQRRLPAQRPQPPVPRRAAATTGSTATAWSTRSRSRTAGRATATAGSAPPRSSARRPRATPCGAGSWRSPRGNPFGTARGLPFKDTANTDLIAPRRQGARHLVPVRAAHGAGSAVAGDPRRRDVPRHAARRHDGAPQGRRAHGRAHVVRLRRARSAAALRRGRAARARSSTRSRSTCPARACRTTWRSPRTTSVLMDLPLVQDQAAARQGRYKITFDRETPSRFAVLPRRGRRHAGPLVRGRALLHLPRRQRVGGGRRRSSWTSAG